MNILFVGEIVGKGGVFCLKKQLKKLKEQYNAHVVVANGDGTTGGFGLGMNHSMYLRKMGINAITSGDCIYFKKDMVEHIQKSPWILRPVNYPYGNPGRGWSYITTTYEDKKLAVISVLGQSGFNRIHLTNPHHVLPDLIDKIRKETPFILVDFHATTTAEKQILAYALDGQVSALLGTGSRALTRDAHILPHGTGTITDTGRTGSVNSVGGLDPQIEIQKFITQIPERSKDWMDRLEIQGVFLKLNSAGHCVHIESFRIPVEGENDRNSRD